MQVVKQTPWKCAILIASGAIGGAERYLVELALAMSLSPAKPVLINLKSALAYSADLAACDVPVYGGIAQHRWDPLGAIRLFRLLRRLKPDVLFINSNRQALWMGIAVGRLCRIPLILIHTHDHLEAHVRILASLGRWTDGIVAASRGHRASLCLDPRLAPDLVKAVYPGIDLRRTRAMPRRLREGKDDVPVVGILAALRPEKDHETFLRAAAMMKSNGVRARFRIIGDGPRRAALEMLAGELGIAGSTEFVGWQAVDRVLFAGLDLLVLSSASETFPAVILEAFSAGVPVVATDVGSVGELLSNPERGVLVPPHDPAALSAAVTGLLQDPRHARRISDEALKNLQFYSSDRFCADILQTFEEVRLSKRQATRRRAEVRA